MRILKWALGLLAVLVLVFVAGGMMLPREVTVARTTQIDAPADQVFPHVNNLQATEAWSPWLGRDPKTKITYGEIPEGVGATMAWASENPQVGVGNMEIVASVPNEMVISDLDFGEMGLAKATYDLTEVEGRTTITWGLQADMGAGPVGRWMGLMMDRWVGADYEQGLSNLKALVESS